jgi:hypothetical protein
MVRFKIRKEKVRSGSRDGLQIKKWTFMPLTPRFSYHIHIFRKKRVPWLLRLANPKCRYLHMKANLKREEERGQS